MTEQQVKSIINTIVRETGHPIAGKVLEMTGIADRKQLRKMVRKGILQQCQVLTARGIMNAYYTNDAIPKMFQERGDDHAEVCKDGAGRTPVGEG